MGFFSKILKAVRKIVPVADVAAEVIEVVIDRPQQKPIAELGTELFYPGSLVPEDGHYACCEGSTEKIRVTKEGSLDILYCKAVHPFPPGWFRGDTFRRVTFSVE